jgi:hypothetical protein
MNKTDRTQKKNEELQKQNLTRFQIRSILIKTKAHTVRNYARKNNLASNHFNFHFKIIIFVKMSFGSKLML